MAVPTYKVCLIGAARSGKSAFCRDALGSDFKENYVPTLGVEVHPLTLHTTIGDVMLNLWDIAGDERYGGLGDGYYIQSKAAIVFCDVTRPESIPDSENLLQVYSHVDQSGNYFCWVNKMDAVEDVELPEEVWPISVRDKTYWEALREVVRRLTGEPELEFIF